MSEQGKIIQSGLILPQHILTEIKDGERAERESRQAIQMAHIKRTVAALRDIYVLVKLGAIKEEMITPEMKPYFEKAMSDMTACLLEWGVLKPKPVKDGGQEEKK